MPADNRSRIREIEKALDEEYGRMGLFHRLTRSLFHSSEFFEAVKGEEGIGKPFKFLVVIALIFSAVFALIFVLLGFLIGLMFALVPGMSSIGALLALFSGTLGLAFGGLLWVIIIATSFVSAAISHLFVKLVGGKGGYYQSYKSLVYSYSALILVWIPLAGIIFAFLGMYNFIVGLSKLHEISKKRVLLSFILQMAVTIGLVMLLLTMLGL